MNVQAVLIATAVVAAVGVAIAVLLSIAEKAFHVDVDEREAEVRECLAGNNCGACGYAGCDALASAIVKGEAPVTACTVAGQAGADKIAAIMGVEAGKMERHVAFVRCSGTTDLRTKKFDYYGTKTCTAVKFALGRGDMSCSFGCMGYGSCVSVCDSKAIRIINGKAVVEPELCVACGKCVKTCPQQLIELVPANSVYRVQCSNKQRGKVVKVNCQAGCIGCGLCERNCPSGAIKVVDNLARIDYTKCTACGLCAEKCPSKVIRKYN